MPQSNYQPSLVLNYGIQVESAYPSRDGGFPNAGLGYIRTYAASREFMMVEAEGAILPISQYSALFSLLGTNYGGNGSTNFAVPNISGRSVIGATSNLPVGGQEGLGTITIESANLPTSAGGIGSALQNAQPSLAMQWVINAEGYYPANDGQISVSHIGVLSQFAGNFEPNGSLFADGRLLSIADYSALFSVIGTTYGGDGIETFALPDLRGRTPIGVGQGFALGEVVGNNATSITNANLPAELNGSGQAISNYGPSLVLNAFMTTTGLYPSSERDFYEEEGTLSEVLFFAGTATSFRNAVAANGQLLSIQTNQALFSLIGNAFGGDGRTTFAVPDLRGRAIVGEGIGPDGDDYYVGRYFGLPSLTLSYNDIPALNLTATVGAPDIIGGSLNDTLNGDNNANVLVGREGNDILNGNGGDDRLNGGPGADIMRGGSGNDTYLVDQAGDQVIELNGEGIDTIRVAFDYVLPDNVENLQMNGASAVNGTGNNLDNVITGSSANNVIVGGAGMDTLSGQTGDDSLSGGDGDDILDGGTGDDVLFGDAGSDDLSGNYGHDTMNGGTGNDRMYGGQGSDIMNGGDDNDTLYGGLLHDSLNGDAGNDIIYGEDGRDRMDGGAGDDILVGGADRDVFAGGAGQDTYRFSQGDFAGLDVLTADRIDDFVRSDGDVIDLLGVDAIDGGHDDAFTFIGSAAFGNTSGQLRYEWTTNNTLISGDTNGDGIADFVIRVDGLIAFVAADFLL